MSELNIISEIEIDLPQPPSIKIYKETFGEFIEIDEAEYKRRRG